MYYVALMMYLVMSFYGFVQASSTGEACCMMDKNCGVEKAVSMKNTPDDSALLAQAKEAMNNAYAPYSQFHVGCALLASSGKVYCGCNVENASYGATLCAERVAITKAVSEGERHFISIAIVSSGGDFTYPCGMCRQVMSEFGLSLRVILEKGTEIKVYTLADLLPHAFTVEQLV